MTNKKKEEEEKALPKVYMLINDKKEYIDPEMVKKHNLSEYEVSPFSGRKLFIEEK